jgi:UDP-glucose 4-epimerase
MKCLVTGATGFIGSELCCRLDERGVDVARTGRELPTDEQLADTKVIYHLAGIAHRAAAPGDYEAVNYRATLDLAARAAAFGARRFIFVSSVNAGPEATAYGYWKWRAEQALASAYAEGNMGVTVIRPALVYGPGAKANLRLLMSAIRRGLPTPPGGETRSMIGLPDLCDALVLMLDVDPGRGRIFFATDGEPYDLQRVHRALATAMGHSPGRAWLPRWCWWVGCTALDLLRGRRPGDTYPRLFGGGEYSNAALREVLGWRPQHRLEDLAPAMVGATP